MATEVVGQAQSLLLVRPSRSAAAVLLVRGVQLVIHLGGGSGQRGAGYPERMKAVQEQLLGWTAQGRRLAVRFTGRLAELARTLGGDAKSGGCLTCARPRWQGTGGNVWGGARPDQRPRLPAQR
ncbi:hypothetical protein [Deinococcus hopiensis]|uniref:hypothetical protein n=1 Tax=Deinococcus hopiensis TaxID=309885 RepID=UPI0009FE2744|nr:hypothetical protein [Deinococcus hopiensis]